MEAIKKIIIPLTYNTKCYFEYHFGRDMACKDAINCVSATTTTPINRMSVYTTCTDEACRVSEKSCKDAFCKDAINCVSATTTTTTTTPINRMPFDTTCKDEACRVSEKSCEDVACNVSTTTCGKNIVNNNLNNNIIKIFITWQ